MRAFFPACFFAALALTPVAAQSVDSDENELMESYEVVDVWHTPIDYTVGYNNQDVVAAREMLALPAPTGKLCYIRFDLLRGEGDYTYGFKPTRLGDTRPDVWGFHVKKIGTIWDQQRSVLKMNVVYFYVDGLKKGADPDICVRKQATQTPQAGNAFSDKGVWSDLVTRVKLVRGWPQVHAQ